ncbi:MAG: hypothetical protein OXL97_14360 [Chloroflexota bacterium]|nr:hypothetical protein [Chloroflexota bacterium]MDE2883743.1 hypothetical protein [Chloroflexota bacterium]
MRLMTLSAHLLLAIAIVAAVGYSAGLWMRAAWHYDVSLWALVSDYMLGSWMFALRMLCIAVMAHAAVRALTAGQRSTRLVWAALVVAVCGSLTGHLHFYFRYDEGTDGERLLLAAVLENAVIGMVFLLARFAILRAGSGR